MRFKLLVLFCIFLYLVGVVQAIPTTNAKNTTSTTNDSLNAPTFTTRTLSTIVPSSVLTLLACTYSTIHPNIPSPNDSTLWRQLAIMIAALIIPELIATWAMRQWFGTRRVTRQFNESGHPIARLDSQDYTWTQTHSFSVLMGGYMLYVDGKPYHALQPHDVLELIRTGCIDAPTLPAADQIYDRSEGNAISKGLIILQAAWFVMQFITRTIYHLETTQLETGTLAFAVLNLATSTVWWNKPLNVQFPHPVHWKSTGSRPEDHINDVTEETFSINVSARGPIFQQIAQMLGADDIPTFRKLRVPTFGSIIELEKLNKTVLLHAGFLVVTIFGGIHCMAWLFAFPTHQGQPEVLWRLSAIAITCAPWFHPLATILAFLVTLVLGDEGATLFFLIWFGSVILYITSRVILLVLMFTTLRSRPPGAYKTVP